MRVLFGICVYMRIRCRFPIFVLARIFVLVLVFVFFSFGWAGVGWGGVGWGGMR